MATVESQSSGKVLGLTLNKKKILEMLGTIYPSIMDPIRELIQNAVDAGAQNIYFDIVEADGYAKFVFWHDGAPIEGETLRAFLEVGTDYKREHGGIGMWGIGRLSWLMLGYEARIWSGDKVLVWDADRLDQILVEPSPEYFSGVRWEISLKPDARIGVSDVEKFVKENYYGPVPVFVAGQRVERSYKRMVKAFEDGHTTVYIVDDGGAIVKDYFKIGSLNRYLLVFTNDPRVRINPARQLVRDTDFWNWEKDVYRGVLEFLKQNYTARGALELIPIDELASMTYDAYTGYREYLRHVPVRLMSGDIVWGDKVIEYAEKHGWGKVVYTSERLTDMTVEMLEAKGYLVVDTSGSWLLDTWLRNLGAKDAVSVAEDLAARGFLESGAERLNKKLFKAFSVAKDVMEEVLGELEEKLRDKKRWGSPPREVEVRVRVNNTERAERLDPSSLLPGMEVEVDAGRYAGTFGESRQHLVKAVVIGRIERDVPIAVARLDNEDIAAFVYNGIICLNRNNSDVAKVLRKIANWQNPRKIAIALLPLIFHEYLHLKYRLDHSDMVGMEPLLSLMLSRLVAPLRGR